MRIIDCHVHPEPVSDYKAALAKLIRHGKAHRIQHMIASDLGDWKAYPSADTLRKANDTLREAAASSQGYFSYLVYLNPQLENFQEELARHAESACGVKLWISLRSPQTGSLERSIRVLQAAAEIHKAVLIHCLDRTAKSLPGEVSLEDIIALAEAVPQCTIVMAHAGGNWRKCIALSSGIPSNVVMDLSGTNPERTMVRRLVDTFGAERILYGSDGPYRSFASQLSKVLQAGLSAEEEDLILFRNAARIFRIPESVAETMPRTPLPEPDLDQHLRGEDHFCFTGSALQYFDHAVSVRDLHEEGVKHRIRSLYAVNLHSLETGDLLKANRSYLEEVRNYPLIRPLATVDLRQKEQSFAQLGEMQGFAGIWITPYLHDYELDYREYAAFFDLCAERKIKLWINTALSDDRFRKETLKTRPVSNQTIETFVRSAPVNFYCFQGLLPFPEMGKIFPDHCFAEYSRLADREYAIYGLLRENPEILSRLLRGSEYPFRYYDTVDNCLSGRW